MKKLIFILTILIQSNYSQYVPEWARVHVHGFDSTTVSYQFDVNSIDPYGNYYTTGYFHLNGYANVLILKYNLLGEQQWSKIYNAPGVDPDIYPAQIYTDSQGFIQIFVISFQNFFPKKFIILKYDNSGNLINTFSYLYQDPNNLLINKIIHDNSNFYFVATILGPQNNDSIMVAKIGNNGVMQWIRTYAGTIGLGNRAQDILTDNLNNVYVTGSVSKPFYHDADIITLKYNSNGVLQWAQTYNYSSPPYYDVGNDILLDNNQNVWVSGSCQSDTLLLDSTFTVILKYNNNGQLQFAKQYNVFYGTETGERIISDNSNLYVQVVQQFNDTLRVLKINTTGQQQWVYKFHKKPNYLNFDNLNNIVSASTRNGYNRTELTLDRINPQGTLDWSYGYTYNGTGTDVPYIFKAGSDSKIFVAGKHNNDLLLLKLTPGLTNTISASRHNLSKAILDSQYVYDTINFNIPAGSFVKDVNVTLDSILHTATGDLEICLVHYTKTDTLVFRRGASFDNFIGTILDDTATTFICNTGLPPYTGYFKPCNALSQFNNLSANGPWILRIYDRRAPDTGELKAWSLNISYESPIGINQISTEIPSKFSLSQNYPNPFNPATKIRFDIPNLLNKGLQPLVQIKVFDILGREITTLVNEQLKPGTYEVTWDASNFASGIYFYKIHAGDFNESKKLILLK